MPAAPTYATPLPTQTLAVTPVTATPAPTVGSTSTPVPATARPTAPPLVTRPGDMVSASFGPVEVAPGGLFHAKVVTSGAVTAVEVDLGSGAPSAPGPRAYSLVEIAPGTWSTRGSVPVASGEYHFTVHLQTGGRWLLRDSDAWNIVVGSVAPTAVPATSLTVPPELLAPPFSYSYPRAAVFSAAGRSVNGVEVVSNARPDIAASTVAGFYNVHLPRAGWSSGSSGVGPSATSFTISATAGSQVCVIEYDSATVHVFYGTLAG